MPVQTYSRPHTRSTCPLPRDPPANDEEDIIDAAADDLADKLAAMTGAAFDILQWRDGMNLKAIMFGRDID